MDETLCRSFDRNKVAALPNYSGVRIGTEKEVLDAPALIRCDNTISTPYNPEIRDVYFDFSRFTQYLHLHNLKERQSRLLDLRHGKTLMTLKDYSDEVLQEELFTIYGEMDASDDLFLKIFQNYKEDRLEEIAEWIREEENITQDLERQKMNIVDSKFKLAKEDVIHFEEVFTQKELSAFDDVGQGNLIAERFVLPRHQNNTTESLKILRDTGIFTNLILFDPQMNLPTTTLPYSATMSDDVDVGDKLAESLQTLIHPHVTGIVVPQLSLAYKNEKGYEPDCHSLGCNNFSELVVHLPHLIWRQQIEHSLPFLQYPTYVEGLISTPATFFRTLSHKFLFILGMCHGLVETSKAIDQFEEIFGFKLSTSILKAWGFQSRKIFFQILFSKFYARHDVQVVPEHEIIRRIQKPKKDSTRIRFYLVRENKVFQVSHITQATETGLLPKNATNTNSVIKSKQVKRISTEAETMNKNTGPSLPLKLVEVQESSLQPLTGKAIAKIDTIMKKPLNNSSTIPTNCVQYGESIPTEFNSVQTKKPTECMLGYYLTPTNFYLILADKWNKLMDLQNNLKTEYTEYLMDSKEFPKLTINPTLLKPSLHLVASRLEEDGFVYYRVKYTKRRSACMHEVFLIDFGEQITVDEHGLFYLRKLHAYDLPAQAIQSALFNVAEPKAKESDSGSGGWSEKLSNKCYEMLSPGSGNPVGITFMNIQVSHNGLRKYLVKGFGSDVKDIGVALMKLLKSGKPC